MPQHEPELDTDLDRLIEEYLGLNARVLSDVQRLQAIRRLLRRRRGSLRPLLGLPRSMVAPRLLRRRRRRLRRR